MGVLVGQIGWSPWSAVKQVANTAARVASDPRAQRAAATAANAYYPEEYQQIQQKVGQARQILRQNDGKPHPHHAPTQPQFDPGAEQFDPGASAPAPINGHFIGLAAVAGAGLILVLLLRK